MGSKDGIWYCDVCDATIPSGQKRYPLDGGRICCVHCWQEVAPLWKQKNDDAEGVKAAPIRPSPGLYVGERAQKQNPQALNVQGPIGGTGGIHWWHIVLGLVCGLVLFMVVAYIVAEKRVSNIEKVGKRAEYESKQAFELHKQRIEQVRRDYENGLYDYKEFRDRINKLTDDYQRESDRRMDRQFRQMERQ